MALVLKVVCRKGVQGRIGDEMLSYGDKYRNRKMAHNCRISTFEAEQAANHRPEGDPHRQHELHPFGDSCAQLCSVLWVQLLVLGGLKQQSGKHCL